MGCEPKYERPALRVRVFGSWAFLTRAKYTSTDESPGVEDLSQYSSSEL